MQCNNTVTNLRKCAPKERGEHRQRIRQRFARASGRIDAQIMRLAVPASQLAPHCRLHWE